MNIDKRKTRKKSSPWVVLAGLAILMVSGHLLTNGDQRADQKNPKTTHEQFDPAAYRNSKEFKEKHTAHVNTEKQISQSAKKKPGKMPVPKPSVLPEHMAGRDKTATNLENMTWPFDPPKLRGNEGKVSQVIKALRRVKDIELDINVYDLGLVRKIEVDEEQRIKLEIVFTTIFCPYSETLKNEMKTSVLGLKWCKELMVTVDVQNPWSRKFLTPEGRHRFKEIFGW